jgi:hypothetical protein
LNIRVGAAESETMEGVAHVVPSSASRVVSCGEFSVEREELLSNQDIPLNMPSDPRPGEAAGLIKRNFPAVSSPIAVLKRTFERACGMPNSTPTRRGWCLWGKIVEFSDIEYFQTMADIRRNYPASSAH